MDVELDRHAGSGEAACVGDALVTKDVEVTDVDVRGCESAEVSEPGGGGDRRDGVAAEFVPEPGRPARVVVVIAPREELVDLGLQGTSLLELAP